MSAHRTSEYLMIHQGRIEIRIVPSELLKLFADEICNLFLECAIGLWVLEPGATVFLEPGVESLVKVVAVVLDGGGAGGSGSRHGWVLIGWARDMIQGIEGEVWTCMVSAILGRGRVKEGSL